MPHAPTVDSIIPPQRRSGWPEPNLSAAPEAWSAWGLDVREELHRLPNHGINMAFEAVDRHLDGPKRDKVALRFLATGGARSDFTFAELASASRRFARLLQDLGVGRGDRVFTLLGRVPELYTAALGTLRNGSVLSPLFSAFGPEPVKSRLLLGDARVLVTTPRLFAKKVAPIRHEVPSLEHVLLVGEGVNEGASDITGVVDLRRRLATTSDAPFLVATRPDDMALVHFTSGTTGKPKGAVHVHEAIAWHRATARHALDLHDDDVFWCTADPGWVTGTSYGILAPLALGVTSIVDEDEFDAGRWLSILAEERVTVWYTAPTAVRMLMKAGRDLPRRYDLASLRFLASVGEPLNPEAVRWGLDVLGVPFHDNWWQTETGGIMLANVAARPIKPGSMGRPLPGVVAAVVERDGDSLRVVEEPDVEGELALRPGWPSMFRGYLHEEARYRQCFQGGWYLTGDLVKRDSEGDYWFVGRADDVIKTAGHLVGPFEVESALLEHEAVAEAAVIGLPDEMAGQVLKAFVTLHRGFVPSEDLVLAILGHARKRLGPAVAPREIVVKDSLPRTRSGKILRRLLRARELGLPEGDTSTLEGAA